MSKESFKTFIRNNPNLINYVNNGEYTWQKFYEMYDLYGEDNNIWDKFKEVGDVKSVIDSVTPKATVGDTSLKDLFNMVKKIDLESVRKGAEGLQKAIALVQDIAKPSASNINNYQARPLYQHFED